MGMQCTFSLADLCASGAGCVVHQTTDNDDWVCEVSLPHNQGTLFFNYEPTINNADPHCWLDCKNFDSATTQAMFRFLINNRIPFNVA